MEKGPSAWLKIQPASRAPSLIWGIPEHSERVASNVWPLRAGDHVLQEVLDRMALCAGGADGTSAEGAGLDGNTCWLRRALSSLLYDLPRRPAVLVVTPTPGICLVALATIDADAVVLDVGVGTGERTAAAETRRIVRRAQPWRLPYPPDTFDGIWVLELATSLPGESVARAFAEFSRVLRPGGHLAVAVAGSSGAALDRAEPNDEQAVSAAAQHLDEIDGLVPVASRPRDQDSRASAAGDTPAERLVVLASKSRAAPGMRRAEHAGCPFCASARTRRPMELGLPGAGSILWGDEALWLTPDVAPLCEGHLLLVSTHHRACFGDWADDGQAWLTPVRQVIRSLLSEAYGQPLLFMEHGPARPGRAGACIDHAHLHCLPTSLPVRAEVERLLGPGQRLDIDGLRRIHGAGDSYVYVEDQSGGHSFVANVLPCQFLRQVVASLEGHEVWRWQSMTSDERTREAYLATISRLAPLIDEACRRGPWPGISASTA